MIAVDDKAHLIEKMSQNMIELKLDRSLATIPDEFSELGAELLADGNSVRLREENGILSKLLKTIYAHGFEVLDIHVKKTTLEDVFMRLTEKK